MTKFENVEIKMLMGFQSARASTYEYMDFRKIVYLIEKRDVGG